MDQVALIPSGTQLYTTYAIAVTDDYLCYASTVAVYVHARNKPSMPLVRILTGPETIVMCIAADADVVVGATDNGALFLWAAKSGDLLIKTKIDEFSPKCIAASPFCPCRILIGGRDLKSYIWLYREGKLIPQIFGGITESGIVTCATYSRTVPNICGVGTSTGSFYLYDMNKVQTRRRIDVVDDIKSKGGVPEHLLDGAVSIFCVEFDPLGDHFALVAISTGILVMYDIHSYTIMGVFEKTTTPIRSLSWLPSQPGNFVTTDSQTPAMKLWNVSSKAPIATFRPKAVPIRRCAMVPGSNSVALGFTDGTVGTFDFAQSKMSFDLCVGHCETVFDAKFAAHCPDLIASASHDRTVKVWCIKDMALEHTIETQNVTYSVDWSPDGSSIAVAMSNGEISMFSLLGKGHREVWRAKVHSDFAWKVTYNTLLPKILATCGKDGTCAIVSAADGTVGRRYRHSGPVFGAQWNPVHANVIAVASFDSRIRIYNIEIDSEQPIVLLEGHKAEAYNVAWNPLVPYVLASGSNDKQIRIWKLNPEFAQLRRPQQEPKEIESDVLVGHTDKVRGLCWCACCAYVLLSGSWDGTIRVWDVRSRCCKAVMHQHAADVYCINTHPQRPLIFVSGSRDTTIRFWYLALLDALFTNAAIGTLGSCLTLDPAASLFSSSTKIAATGDPILLLQEQLVAANPPIRPIDRLQYVASFFSFPYGAADVVSCVKALVSEPLASSERRNAIVIPMDALTDTTMKKAEEAATARSKVASAVGGSLRHTALITAAEMFVKLGKFKEYCELLVDAGEWERAMATAPMVSLDYWRSLCERAAESFAAAGDSRAVECYITSCHAFRAAEFLAKRRAYSDAITVVQHCPQQISTTASKSDDASSRLLLPELVDARVADMQLHILAREQGSIYKLAGNPILAAAAMASTNSPADVISTLVAARSIPLAHLVFHVLPLSAADIDRGFEASAMHCASIAQWNSAALCIVRHSAPSYHAAHLLAMYCAAPIPLEKDFESLKQVFLGCNGVYDVRESVPEVSHLVQLCLALNFAGTLPAAQALIDRTLQEGDLALQKLQQLRRALALVVLPDAPLSEPVKQFLGSAYYVSALLSIRLEYPHLATPFMKCAASFNPVFATYQQHVAKDAAAAPTADPSVFVPLGGQLPTRSPEGSRALSCLSGEEISGTPYVLEDGKSLISSVEAMEYFQCCPFSPLPTAMLINPY